MRKGSLELKKFIFLNGLEVWEVADYVGVSSSFISQVTKGNKSLPDKRWEKLVNNDKGWDVSMFMDEAETRRGDAELQKLKEMYNQLLCERDERIRVLEMELCKLKASLNSK